MSNKLKAMDYEALALVLGLIPNVELGAPTTMGATFGGTQLATIAQIKASQKEHEANEHLPSASARFRGKLAHTETALSIGGGRLPKA
jgi:hypothetical protein